jgi:hypothetical protein
MKLLNHNAHETLVKGHCFILGNVLRWQRRAEENSGDTRKFPDIQEEEWHVTTLVVGCGTAAKGARLKTRETVQTVRIPPEP